MQPQFGLWEIVVAIGGFFGALTLMGLISSVKEHGRQIALSEKDIAEKYVLKSDYRNDMQMVRNDVHLLGQKMDRMLDRLRRENDG